MHRWTSSRYRAIAEVQVDERLVWYVQFTGETLEIFDSRFVQAHRHRLLEALRVRIRVGLGEIVLLSHRFHRASYWARIRNTSADLGSMEFRKHVRCEAHRSGELPLVERPRAGEAAR